MLWTKEQNRSIIYVTKRRIIMDIINHFLESHLSTGNSKEDIPVTADEVERVNSMFSSLRSNLQCLRILPKYRKGQIWTVKTHYLDYEGVLQQSNHNILVLLISNPEDLDDDTSFVRVCPITPFIETVSSTDQLCDDSSIIGFPFFVETWNEQPMLTELLDNFVADYYLDVNEKYEPLTNDQKCFREIEISNSLYLNHSVTSYMNEMERANDFAFSVDLYLNNTVKTIHMPVLNVQAPKLVHLSDHKEYAQAARLNNRLTENDCIEVGDEKLPFTLEVRKKSSDYVLTIIPKVDVLLIKNGKEIHGMSNSERIVYNGLRKGIYQIMSKKSNDIVTIRLK